MYVYLVSDMEMFTICVSDVEYSFLYVVNIRFCLVIIIVFVY